MNRAAVVLCCALSALVSQCVATRPAATTAPGQLVDVTDAAPGSDVAWADSSLAPVDGSAPPAPRRAPAPPLFASRIERGFVAESVEYDAHEWIDDTDAARRVRHSPTLIESYIDRRRGVIIEVHAVESESDERSRHGPPDAAPGDTAVARWARAWFARWAPAADLSERSLEGGMGFRASERADHGRRAEVRLYQVEWRSAPDDQLYDVLVGASERGAATYVVYVVVPAGAAHWDALEDVPDRASIPRRALRLAHALHERYIAPL